MNPRFFTRRGWLSIGMAATALSFAAFLALT